MCGAKAHHAQRHVLHGCSLMLKNCRCAVAQPRKSHSKQKQCCSVRCPQRIGGAELVVPSCPFTNPLGTADATAAFTPHRAKAGVHSWLETPGKKKARSEYDLAFGRNRPLLNCCVPELFSGFAHWRSHHLLVLCTSPEPQSTGQNNRDHDRFQKFQFYLASFRRKLLRSV